MKTNYSILITGDLVISKEYHSSNIDDNIVSLFKNSDLNIVNLEAPVTNSNKTINKTGPNIKSHEQSTKDVLDKLDIDVVTLANNHVLDYDEQGVADTLSFCKANNIRPVGAGMNLEEASEILYVETQEGKIAIINFAENEWTAATEKTAGANPMDLINNFKQLQEAKKVADFVIVIVHGGNEHYAYPSPRMVKQYRFYAENGADAVISHHTHCISGYEIYNEVPIFYSLGNFLFTEKSNRKTWYSGLVVSLQIEKGKKIGFDVIPIEQSEDKFELSLPNQREREMIFENISQINEIVSDSRKLGIKWNDFVKSVEAGFLKRISPLGAFNNRFVKAILYRSGIYKLLLNQSYVKEHLNRIRCEAHYDITKDVFINLLKK